MQVLIKDFDVQMELKNNGIELEIRTPSGDHLGDLVITKTQLDECMGPKFEQSTHEKIEVAVKVYHEAAKAFTEVMKITNASYEDRKAATNALFESALNLLTLLPEGDKRVAQLKKLTGR